MDGQSKICIILDYDFLCIFFMKVLSFYLFSVFLNNLVCYLVFQGLLEGVGHPFTRNFHFIDSVKAYLSYALLRASVSPSPIIFQVYLCSSSNLDRIFYRMIASDLQFPSCSMQPEFFGCFCCGLEKVSRCVYDLHK